MWGGKAMNNTGTPALDTQKLYAALRERNDFIAASLRLQAEAEYAADGHIVIDTDSAVAIQDEGLHSGFVRGWVSAWTFVEIPLREPGATEPKLRTV